MFPILFKSGFITIYTVGVLHALAFLAGIVWVNQQIKKTTIDAEVFGRLIMVIIIWAVIGARVFSVLFDGNLAWYLANPAKILMVWEGGLTFYGGFLFALVAGLWYTRYHKLNTWKVADIMAPALALGGAIGRLGCFASGDSFGKPSSLPWAVVFGNPHSLAPTGIPLHPTQIYSVITNLALFGFLVWYRKRWKFRGEIFLLYVILYAVTRFMVEIFRNDPRGVYLGGLISTSQIIGLIAAAVAIILYGWKKSEMVTSEGR
jgi:phosphatidylglycerol:prolipoprotein diacylglycerol transferase